MIILLVTDILAKADISKIIYLIAEHLAFNLWILTNMSWGCRVAMLLFDFDDFHMQSLLWHYDKYITTILSLAVTVAHSGNDCNSNDSHQNVSNQLFSPGWLVK